MRFGMQEREMSKCRWLSQGGPAILTSLMLLVATRCGGSERDGCDPEECAVGPHVLEVGCEDGECVIVLFEDGWADCDGDYDTGCENSGKSSGFFC